MAFLGTDGEAIGVLLNEGGDGEGFQVVVIFLPNVGDCGVCLPEGGQLSSEVGNDGGHTSRFPVLVEENPPLGIGFTFDCLGGHTDCILFLVVFGVEAGDSEDERPE